MALGLLRPVHQGFQVAAIAAGLAVFLSLPEWIGAQGALIEVPTALAVLSGALVLALVAAAADPSAGFIALAIGVVDLAVVVWFLVMLFGLAKVTAPDPVSCQPG